MNTQEKKSIIVADDHPMFRHGIVRQIEDDKSFTIVGEIGNGEEAMGLIEKLRPDMALLDISMPGLNGLEIVLKCKEGKLPTEFVLLTMYKEEQYFNRAMDIGVKGYLLKENTFEELLACLKSVAEGRHYISPLLSGYMVKRHARLESLRKKTPALTLLTGAEKQIMKLIAAYKTSKEIADELNVSHRTIEKHRNNICTKLDLKGANRLLQFAMEHEPLL